MAEIRNFRHLKKFDNGNFSVIAWSINNIDYKVDLIENYALFQEMISKDRLMNYTENQLQNILLAICNLEQIDPSVIS